MARKYWWQKVADPDRLVEAAGRPVSDQRIRTMTALQQAGAFRDEPEILHGLVNSNVPLALSLRAFDSYSATKQRKITEIGQAAGYGPKSQDPAQRKAGEIEQSVNPQPQQEGEGASFLDWLLAVAGGQVNPERFGRVVGDVSKTGIQNSAVAPAIDAVGTGMSATAGVIKKAGEGLIEGAGAIMSPVTASAQAGYASDTALDRGLNSIVEGAHNIPVAGDILGPASAAVTGLIGLPANLIEGAGKLGGGGLGSPIPISNQQRKDMRRAGYNPDEFTSRYAYYYQSFGNKRSPVSDSDVAKLKNQFDPGDVDAAREIVISGSLNDQARSFGALSGGAQDLLRRASNNDAGAQNLLKAMADNSQLNFGGKLVANSAPDAKAGELWGQGSGSRAAAAAVADLAAYWYADPLVAAGAGLKSTRAAMWGVKADDIDNVVAAVAAADDAYQPVGAVAKRFDQAMETADRIVRLRQQAEVENLPEAAIEAGRLYASWNRQYPSMRSAFDTMLGMRTGAIGRLSIREGDSAVTETGRAVNAGRTIRPWVVESAVDGKPLWSFTDDAGNHLTAAGRAEQRAKLAEEIGTFVFAEAYSSGRELIKSNLLLPGQLSVNGKIRDVMAKHLEAVTGRDKSAMRQMLDVKGTIHLDEGVTADLTGRYDQLLNPASQEWVRENYTFGTRHMFARGWRNFEKTFSNLSLNPVDPSSTETFGRLINQFMPKRQAQMITAQWAGANPGERYVMLRQTVTAMLNVMNLRNTPEAQKLVERATKGLVPSDDAINGFRAGGHEWYTTPDGNRIRVGEHEMAAAVHPWQLNEGYELPNWREIRSLVDRNAFLNAVTQTTNGPLANSLIQAWKASKTSSYANAMRQAIEGLSFTVALSPEAAGGVRKTRAAVRADSLMRKVNDNDLARLANQVNNFTADDRDLLEAARKQGHPQYVDTISALLQKNGVDSRAADVLARLGESVSLEGMASGSEFAVKRLALAGPIDFVRKVRAERAYRKGGSVNDSPLAQYFDDELEKQFTEAAFKQLGVATDNYVSSSERIDREVREHVFASAGKGYTHRPEKLQNAYKWLGDKAEITPVIWAGELGKRFADTPGNLAMRYLAREALHGRDAAKAWLLGQEQSLGLAADIGGVDGLMRAVYREHPLGEAMRTNGARLQYLPNGQPVRSNADLVAAADATAVTAVDDLVHHMGGKVTRDPETRIPTISFPDEVKPILEKIANNEAPTADDLARLGEEFRPDGMTSVLQAVRIGGEGTLAQRIANASSRAYGTIVAEPLAKMVLQPIFLAERRIAYGEVEPLMQGLLDKGLSTSQAAFLLESMANGRAVSKTFQVTDNPTEKSVFSELADKYLMFNRANEDFLRRLFNATKANPGAVGRVNTLMTAGVHAGAIHYEPATDIEGNTEYHMTFTYPGSALAQRVVMDAAVSLGLAPEEMLRIPQFDGLKSQVRFINPGISNPIQFSANPIFGLALDKLGALFPSAQVGTERIKRALSGGEDFGGGQSALQQWTPAMFQRFVPMLQQDDADGQWASAVRTAMIYAEAAGTLPGPDASPQERAEALDAVKATAANTLTLRALFGAIAPAAPQNADPDLEQDAMGRLEGLPNVRSEWFDILGDYSRKHSDNPNLAFQEAQVEWLKRYPKGELVVNPNAFLTGSTEILGSTKNQVPYTIEATQWMLDNYDFVKSNPTVALALMPVDMKDGNFNNEAYKIQLKADLRKHKGLEEFYTAVTLSDDLNAYYDAVEDFKNTRTENPSLSKALYSKQEDWEATWRRAHPLASAELDRRAEPNFVHAEIAPAIERIAVGEYSLPAGLAGHREQVAEMYADYAEYRQKFMAVDTFAVGERLKLNKAYRQGGDQKWLTTPLEPMWKLMRVYEEN